jgi:protein phosphatase
VTTKPRSASPRRVEFAAHSDVGRVRTRNEDALETCPERGWAVLADGMGGYRGGDVAARLAVSAALRRLEYEAAADRMQSVETAAHSLARAVEDANTEVLRAGIADPDLAGMGATLLAVAFLDGQAVSAHVGDSRLYRWREGEFEQLTRDHTMLQEQVDGGVMSAEDARHSRYRGMLTRGVGVASLVQPELGVHVARAGDLFLLCSDGLTDMLDDDEIAAVLAGGEPLRATAEHLVAQANLHGGRDNVSVIVARMAV